MNKRKFQHILLAINAALAVCAGVFFGLFSCGGYAWHKTIYFFLQILASLAWVVFAVIIYRETTENQKRIVLTVTTCLLFFPCIYLLFYVVLSATAPFYPSSPASFAEWWHGFVSSFQTGSPC